MTEQKKEKMTSKENVKNQKKMAVLAGEETRKFKSMSEEIKREKTKLEAELDQVGIKQKKKIEVRLNELDSLSKQLSMFRKMGGKDGAAEMLELVRIENELKLLRAQGSVNERIASAKGNAKVYAIEKESKVSNVRRLGSIIASFFRGARDINAEDISAARRATELLREKIKQTKTEQKKALFEAATNILEGYIRGYDCSKGQVSKLVDEVIKQAQEQLQNEK